MTAVSSTVARTQVLWESIVITLEHPVFGVGPAQFVVAAEDRAREHGSTTSWSVTHNTYTELSSETGIPGLLFYMAALLWSFRCLASCRAERAHRWSETADLARMALCLRVALLAYAVCGIFMNLGYHMYFPVLAGLAIAVSAAHKQVRAAQEREAVPAAPARLDAELVTVRSGPDSSAKSLQRSRSGYSGK
jgi:O-antigen ligase